MTQSATRSGPVTHKTCGDCGERKERHEYSKRKSSPDGLQNQCKPCAAVRRAHYSNGLSESLWKSLTKVPRRDDEVELANRRQYFEARSKPGGRLCPKCNAKMRSYSVLKTCESCHRKIAQNKAKDKAPG
jgi:hypothetical protein